MLNEELVNFDLDQPLPISLGMVLYSIYQYGGKVGGSRSRLQPTNHLSWHW
jgi:hypothetical protein